MPLDIHWGILSIVKILIYIPILFLVFRISRKYGVKEKGWICLFIFSLIRIIGSILMIAAEQNRYNSGLGTGGYALEASGFSPLLLCTVGLTEMIAEGPHRNAGFRSFVVFILYFFGIAAMGVTIAGVASQIAGGFLLFLGACFYGFLWVFSVTAVVVLWTQYSRLLEYRRKLLVAVSLALPFLTVREVYAFLSILSSAGSYYPVTGAYGTNVKPFNFFDGEWQIYLGMSVMMEYAVVIIYTVAGTMLPLDKDYERQEIDELYLYHQR